jgi:S1-C subfamily serine protease
MMRKTVLAFFVILLSACTSGVYRGKPLPTDRHDVCLFVDCRHSGGTAFVAAWGGSTVLVTAWHVVQWDRGEALVRGNGVERRVTFSQYGDLDLGVVTIDPPTEWRVLPIADPTPSVRVVAWGYGDGLLQFHFGDLVGPTTITRYRFSIWGQTHEDKPGGYLSFTTPVVCGMSGGPILNTDGYVIAVVAMQRRDGTLIGLDLP